RLLDQNPEKSVVLVERADAYLQVLVQPFPVVGFRHDREGSKVQRNRERPGVPHGADQLPVTKRVIPREADFSDLDLRAFDNLEDQDDRVARAKALILRSNRRELPAVLGQQVFQYQARLHDPRGIELALHRQADLAVAEAFQNVRLGDRMDSLVADAADDRPLFQFKNDNFRLRPARVTVYTQRDVLEKFRVP